MIIHSLPADLQRQDWDKALRHVAPPVDFGLLRNYLIQEFKIQNFSPLNEDLLLTCGWELDTFGTISDSTYGFDRDGRGDGLLLAEIKILDAVPPNGQYRHLVRAAKSGPQITSVVFHIAGTWYADPMTGHVAHYFDPIAVRIHYPKDKINDWQRVTLGRDEIFRAIGDWYKSGRFTIHKPN